MQFSSKSSNNSNNIEKSLWWILPIMTILTTLIAKLSYYLKFPENKTSAYTNTKSHHGDTIYNKSWRF